MSATVRIKTKATNIGVIRRMAECAGWGEVQERNGYAYFSIHKGKEPSWTNRISINLSTGESTFDSDFRELRTAAERINQEYEAATAIREAESRGLTWERETNEEGYPVVYVDIPDTEMEVNYG